MALVVAAQAGDRRALDDLVAGYLPWVYTIVRRALDGHPDVDDIVQETMLRALRELPDLRVPESFRAWLAAITLRQISTYAHRRRLGAQRTVALDETAELPAVDANFEGLAVLRMELSGQRRQVVRAGQWLDSDDRALLSLWWLEIAGELTRTELAAAIGVSVAHAGVRIQRMRTQLDLSRSLVAALDARSRCPGLNVAVADWDARPSPLWRKRIARHIRSCATCSRAADDLVPAERLHVGFTLLPVPIALTAALLGRNAFATTAAAATTTTAVSGATSVGAKAGLISHLVQGLAAHPITAALVTGTLIAGAVVTTTHWPTSKPPPPVAVAAPSSAPTPPRPSPPASSTAPTPARSLAPGPASLESVNKNGFFVSTADNLGIIAHLGPSSSALAREQATFDVVSGLADANCFSFRARDGRYLRHSSWRLRLYPYDGTKLFRGDATFCARPGSAKGSVFLESSNYPGCFLRHRGNELWVDRSDGTSAFRADSSFRVWQPLAY